jgi:4-alpha-glucanotransferase
VPALFPRSAGILLHPTSLPGPDGVGDLGPAAHRWLEWLGSAGQKIWQVLPLGPTGLGDSPYQSYSAFAGNPLLISAEVLSTEGLLDSRDLADRPAFPGQHVAFPEVARWKRMLLDRAFARYRSGAARSLRARFEEFRAAHASWLDDYARFMALRAESGGAHWTAWEPPVRDRESAALAAVDQRLAEAIEAERFRQFLFAEQWRVVHAHARELGIRVFGDVPIFVAHDSADVWAHREWFRLTPDGSPEAVAGVPPDYFSATGQLWGNPLYRWDRLEQHGYAWWIERLRVLFERVDIVRIDHFRGFEAFWEIPAGAETAVEGRWVKGPGERLFAALRQALGSPAIVAEDLGVVTPEVEALRDQFELPGMKVLQFAFGDDDRNPFLPHHHPARSVVYTGTHDNDTTRGWYEHGATESERDHVRRYLRSDGTRITRDLIEAALASPADTAIVPLQDVLELGSEARMNVPGRADGNWTWRFRWEDIPAGAAGWLRDATERHGR